MMPLPERPTLQTAATRFAWLHDRSQRRSALIDVQATLRKGWLSAEDRAALIRELETLVQSGDLWDLERTCVDLLLADTAGQHKSATRRATEPASSRRRAS